MERKVALPVKEGVLYRTFEKSQDFMLFTLNEQKIIREELVSTHLQPEFYPFWLAGMGVTDLITRNILSSSVKLLNQHKINVFVGVDSNDPLSLMMDFVQATLETFDVVDKRIPMQSS